MLGLIGILGAGIFFLNKSYQKEKKERLRLENNQRVLISSINQWRTKNGDLVARTESLNLKVWELERYNAEITAELKDMKIRPKDVDVISKVEIEQSKEVSIPIRDTSNVLPIVSSFSYSDQYTRIKGTISTGSPQVLNMTYMTTDSLTLIHHIQKKKFLFIRWGVKNEWWDIKNKNPANTITGFRVIKVIK